MSINSSSSAGGSSSGGGGGGGGCGSGGGGPCGACKFLRRKCVPGCIFAPYFDSEQGATHFAAVHKVFGASNVSKLLLNIPVHKRLDAVVTICFEAQARLRDPVYGCVANIFALQQQVVSLQAELSYLQGQFGTLEMPQPQALMAGPTAISLGNANIISSGSPSYDLSSLFDPMAQTSWAMQQRPMDLRQHGPPGPSSGGGDLHELARELLNRNPSPPPPPPPPPLPPHSAHMACSKASSSSPSLFKS